MIGLDVFGDVADDVYACYVGGFVEWLFEGVGKWPQAGCLELIY